MFASFDTNGYGSLSQTELDTGFAALHQAMASAVKKHKSGNSESLMDMLFGKSSDTSSTSDATSSATTAAGTTDSPFTGNSSGTMDTSSSDSSSNPGTNVMRMQQWMLDAFSSQFNVSNAFANAA